MVPAPHSGCGLFCSRQAKVPYVVGAPRPPLPPAPLDTPHDPIYCIFMLHAHDPWAGAPPNPGSRRTKRRFQLDATRSSAQKTRPPAPAQRRPGVSWRVDIEACYNLISSTIQLGGDRGGRTARCSRLRTPSASSRSCAPHAANSHAMQRYHVHPLLEL